jgi:hypothetical protein
VQKGVEGHKVDLSISVPLAKVEIHVLRLELK